MILASLSGSITHEIASHGVCAVFALVGSAIWAFALAAPPLGRIE